MEQCLKSEAGMFSYCVASCFASVISTQLYGLARTIGARSRFQACSIHSFIFQTPLICLSCEHVLDDHVWYSFIRLTKRLPTTHMRMVFVR